LGSTKRAHRTAFVWMPKTWPVNLPRPQIVGVQALACCFGQCGRLKPVLQRIGATQVIKDGTSDSISDFTV
jgi:hypothetical protein